MERRELVIVNRDGKRMPSTLRTPTGAPHGTFVLLHGLGGLRDQKLIKDIAEAFADQGYVTFAFDDSHAVKSLDGAFFEATTTQNLHDVEDALAYVRRQPWCTPPLILLGHSMGGFAAVRHARLHPADAARLVLLAPAMSWKTMWGAAVPFLLVWLATGKRKFLSIDDTHYPLGRAWILDFSKYDAQKDAPHVGAPTLILSAEFDETVAKPREHRRFAARFPRADQITIRAADHDFDGHEKEVIATIKKWLTSS